MYSTKKLSAGDLRVAQFWFRCMLAACSLFAGRLLVFCFFLLCVCSVLPAVCLFVAWCWLVAACMACCLLCLLSLVDCLCLCVLSCLVPVVCRFYADLHVLAPCLLISTATDTGFPSVGLLRVFAACWALLLACCTCVFVLHNLCLLRLVDHLSASFGTFAFLDCWIGSIDCNLF